ncbi:hypothetical protein BX600DRAFT_508917 [Xylariales sp. PMI_506]|nr:hypothetical protein BX600DRAFT_508917 [Xylariales sp. PMI_506]
MVATPERLMKALVAYWVATWRSNGTLVTLQEMIDSSCHLAVRGAPAQGENTMHLSMKHSKSYLRITFDDSLPANINLRKHKEDLGNFMTRNPSIVLAMYPLLDEQIEMYGLINLFGMKSQAQMSHLDKIQLLARYHLQLDDEPIPPGLAEANREHPEIKIIMLRMNWKGDITFERHVGNAPTTVADFTMWLQSIAEPQSPADTGDETLQEWADAWRREDELAEIKPCSWSYKMFLNYDSTQKLKDGLWQSLDSGEDFHRLLDELKDDNLRLVFIKTHLLEEARLLFTDKLLSSIEHGNASECDTDSQP